MNATERIAKLVEPELLNRIPSFVRGHALDGTSKLVAREYPDLYEEAGADGEMSKESRERLAKIVNDTYRERMAKHGM